MTPNQRTSPRRTSRSASWRVAAVALAFSLGLVGGCASSGKAPPSDDSPTATATTPGPAALEADARIERIAQTQWQDMVAAGLIRPECPVQRRGQLRSVRVNFIDFQGRTQRGQLVVNADVAESVAGIFTQLFEIGFPIRRMRPIEEYGGDTNASLRADNTSAFNCRRPDQINAPFLESPHANGRAVDINPRENPWMDLRCKCWFPSAANKDRVEGPGVILRRGPVWRIFRVEGWIWQNIDVPDFMHFDTGYPSRPFGASDEDGSGSG